MASDMATSAKSWVDRRMFLNGLKRMTSLVGFLCWNFVVASGRLVGNRGRVTGSGATRSSGLSRISICSSMVVMPCRNSLALPAFMDGTGRMLSSGDVDDVPDVVGHHAALALALAVFSDNTMITVAGVELGARQREQHAQIEDRHDGAAQVEHAQHEIRRLGNAGHRGPAANFLYAQDVDAVGLAPQRKGQDLTRATARSPLPLAWIHCCASTTRCHRTSVRRFQAVTGSLSAAGGVGHRGSASHFVTCAPGVPCHKA